MVTLLVIGKLICSVKNLGFRLNGVSIVMGKTLSKLSPEERHLQYKQYYRYRMGHGQYDYSTSKRNLVGEMSQEKALEFYKRHRLNNLRTRCKKAGLPFNLTIEDFNFPKVCPALGIPLEKTFNKDSRCVSNENTPSLDRIVPELGYVKGNIVIVSKKANTMKSNGNWQDLQKLADFYKELDSSRRGNDNNTQ
jgi:hypothetical protein